MDFYRCTLQGSIFTWYPKPSREMNVVTRKKDGSKKHSRRKKSTLRKQAERRRNKLMKRFFTLKKKPRCFVSLLYPNTVSRTVSGKAIKRDLDRLGTRIRKKYPESWFIYSIEWKIAGGFHIHLHGCPKKGGRPFHEFVSDAWLNIVSSIATKLVAVSYNSTPEESDKRSTYLLSRAKFKDKMVVIDHLKGAYDHGIINRKNLPVAKPILKVLSAEQLKILRRLMFIEYANYCSERGLETNEWHLRKIMHGDAYFNILRPGSKVAKFLSTI